jgi:hypothetical protein
MRHDCNMGAERAVRKGPILLHKMLAIGGHGLIVEGHRRKKEVRRALLGASGLIFHPQVKGTPVTKIDKTPTPTATPQPEASDIIWGAAAIGEFLNLPSERAAFHLLPKLNSVRKVGGRYAASRAKLLAEASGA